MKIYVASSWRNRYQQEVVSKLRLSGFLVYDFRYPKLYNDGFKWSDIDENWKTWETKEFYESLNNDIAIDGFNTDMEALDECDLLICVLPSGRSAHLEAGYVIGRSKPVLIYSPEPCEPELMYKMCDLITDDIGEIIQYIKVWKPCPF